MILPLNDNKAVNLLANLNNSGMGLTFGPSMYLLIGSHSGLDVAEVFVEAWNHATVELASSQYRAQSVPKELPENRQPLRTSPTTPIPSIRSCPAHQPQTRTHQARMAGTSEAAWRLLRYFGTYGDLTLEYVLLIVGNLAQPTNHQHSCISSRGHTNTEFFSYVTVVQQVGLIRYCGPSQPDLN